MCIWSDCDRSVTFTVCNLLFKKAVVEEEAAGDNAFLLVRAKWQHAVLFSWVYIDFHARIGIHQFRRRVEPRLTPGLTLGTHVWTQRGPTLQHIRRRQRRIIRSQRHSSVTLVQKDTSSFPTLFLERSVLSGQFGSSRWHKTSVHQSLSPRLDLRYIPSNSSTSGYDRTWRR